MSEPIAITDAMTLTIRCYCAALPAHRLPCRWCRDTPGSISDGVRFPNAVTENKPDNHEVEK